MNRRACWLLAALLAGCAANQTFNQAKTLIEGGEIEAGLAKAEEAARLEPGRREYVVYALRQRELAVARLLALGDEARRAGKLDDAEEIFRRADALQPGSPRVQAALQAVEADRRHRKLLDEAEALLAKKDLEGAYAKIREVLNANPAHREAHALLRALEQASPPVDVLGPQLRARFRTPVTVEFRDATVRQVFEFLGKNTELNFLFDREVRTDQRTTVFIRDTAVEEVIQFLLLTNQLDQRVLNDSTLLIYPRTPAKQREYQQLVTKSFFLGNASAKQTLNLIRTLVKTKDVFIDEDLNLVVMRDTPEAIRMTERLLASQDLAKPEVMLEVEVLEVSTASITELGIRYPDQISYSLVGASGTAGSFTLREWQNRSSDMVQISVTNPALILNFKDQLSRSNLLANPRIRVRNREKAKIHIGDKVPVITTTAGATGFVSESVNYLDVGLKLEVEPEVFLENEVGMKVGLEVSNIAQEVRSSSGTLTYRVGTRLAATTLRLKDGETQILAGLISDEDRSSANRVPGLGSLPVLGRLFGSQGDNVTKTEIILLITPRVVRNLARPDFRTSEFLSGTEAVVGAAPLRLQTVAPAAASPTEIKGTETKGTSSSAAAASGPVKISLQAPAHVLSGEEFKVAVHLGGGNTMLRSAILDFAFDPSRFSVVSVEEGALVKAAGPESGLRTSAPEGLGRIAISLTAKSDFPANGELAVLTLKANAPIASSASIVLESVSLTDSTGRVLSATTPPPHLVSLIK
jgi:general secretion pathway protein D